VPDESDRAGDDNADRAALRAYFRALEEALRSGRELEALCDVLQGAERRDTIDEIFARLEHLHELARDHRRR
jgi:hypothetical protein